MGRRPEHEPDGDVATETVTRKQTKPPPRFKVLLHNDDYTTMDFVVAILEQVFRHDHETAVAIMFDVHRKGIGLAGVYPREIAESKVEQVTRLAEAAEFPLLSTLELE